MTIHRIKGHIDRVNVVAWAFAGKVKQQLKDKLKNGEWKELGFLQHRGKNFVDLWWPPLDENKKPEWDYLLKDNISLRFFCDDLYNSKKGNKSKLVFADVFDLYITFMDIHTENANNCSSVTKPKIGLWQFAREYCETFEVAHSTLYYHLRRLSDVQESVQVQPNELTDAIKTARFNYACASTTAIDNENPLDEWLETSGFSDEFSVYSKGHMIIHEKLFKPTEKLLTNEKFVEELKKKYKKSVSQNEAALAQQLHNNRVMLENDNPDHVANNNIPPAIEPSPEVLALFREPGQLGQAETGLSPQQKEKVERVMTKAKNRRKNKNKTNGKETGTRMNVILSFGYDWKKPLIFLEDYEPDANGNNVLKPCKYLTSELYIKKFVEPMALDTDINWKIDNASGHSSRETITKMNELNFNCVGFQGQNVAVALRTENGYPSRSCDFMPAEPAISSVKHRYYNYMASNEGSNLNVIARMKHCLNKAWDDISQEFLNKCTLHVWNAMEECVAAGGDYGETVLRNNNKQKSGPRGRKRRRLNVNPL